MINISRFRSCDPSFPEQISYVVEWWSSRPGCLSMHYVRNIDDPELWALVGHWESIGAYRRSMSGTEAKMVLTPFLLQAIDEPSAYLAPENF